MIDYKRDWRYSRRNKMFGIVLLASEVKNKSIYTVKHAQDLFHLMGCPPVTTLPSTAMGMFIDNEGLLCATDMENSSCFN